MQFANNPYSFMTILVQGEEGANIYPVAAGSTVLLMDFNSGMFWLKTTDNTGIPQPLRRFNFKEIPNQMQGGQIPPASNNGVSREEFEELRKQINELLN